MVVTSSTLSNGSSTLSSHSSTPREGLCTVASTMARGLSTACARGTMRTGVLVGSEWAEASLAIGPRRQFRRPAPSGRAGSSAGTRRPIGHLRRPTIRPSLPYAAFVALSRHSRGASCTGGLVWPLEPGRSANVGARAVIASTVHAWRRVAASRIRYVEAMSVVRGRGRRPYESSGA